MGNLCRSFSLQVGTVLFVAVMFLVPAQARASDPAFDAFTYQGQLRQGGIPHAGAVDLTFRLFDAPVEGTQAGPDIVAEGFSDFDEGGRFAIDLLFGKGAFTGAPRWLEISVNDTVLTPRQPMMPVPYAIHALNVTAVTDEALAGAYTNWVELTNPGNVFSGSGTALTDLNASNVSSGSLHVDRLPAGGQWQLASPLILGSASNPALFVQPANGRLGIGLINPEARLHAVTAESAAGSRAIFGHSTSPNGDVAGVVGRTDSSTGKGVHGIATANSSHSSSSGVYGESAAPSGAGVFGISNPYFAGWGFASGVRGEMSGSLGAGVIGLATGTNSEIIWGLYAEAYAPNGTGAYGSSSGTTGSGIGVHGHTSSPNGFAGYFTGPVGSRNYFERGVAIGTLTPTAFFHVVAPSGNGHKVDMPGFSTRVTNLVYTVTGGWGTTFTNVVGGVVLGGGVDAAGNVVTDNFGTVSGGSTNRAGNATGLLTDAMYATVGGGDTNIASGTRATVGGGGANLASAVASTVGGGAGNRAGALQATVAGGLDNVADGISAAIGGGERNEAVGFRSSIGGGHWNIAGGEGATIGGGEYHMSAGNAATVGGGFGNGAIGEAATVAGGALNFAPGNWSTVPGGLSNVAGADYSFAAGRQAQVRSPFVAGNSTGDTGTFVWADASGEPFVSTYSNQFLIRATGGVGIGTNLPDARVHMVGGSAATTAPGTGTLQIGPSMEPNFVLDGNRMIARDAGNLAPMSIQSTGIRVGTGTAPFATFHIEGTTGFPGLPGFRIRYDGATKLNHSANGGLNIGSAAEAPNNGLRVLGQSILVQQVGIGRTPTVNMLEVEGSASKTTAGSWLANSDARIKTQVRDLEDALEVLERVRPVAFRYTDAYRAAHPSIENAEYFNVIAQEFAEVFPEAVRESGQRMPNGEAILQVDTYPMLIHAVAAIRQLRAEKDRELELLRSELHHQRTATEQLLRRIEELEARRQ